MRQEKKSIKVRESISSHIEAIQKCDQIRSRVEKVMKACGYSWHSSLWRKFDCSLAQDVWDSEEREKILRRLFSRYGSGIRSFDDQYIEIIEKILIK
jgi:hypothetical protein